MKSFFDELTGYRVKVVRNGKEVVNVPGILALPGMLIAPKMSLIGMVAAPLLGCDIHVENENGQAVDVGKAVREAADTVVDTAKKTVRTVKEEMDKAWEDVSADDPETEGEEGAEAPQKEADVPEVRVETDDSEQA